MNNILELRPPDARANLVLKNRMKILYKILITLLVMCSITLYIYGIVVIEKSEPFKFLIPFITVYALILFFLIRSWLWSLFGKEHIVLCDTRIIHFYEFGMIKTKPKIIRFDKLAYSLRTITKESNKQIGVLTLLNQPYKTIEPEPLLQTSVILDIDELKHLANYIYSYYEGEGKDELDDHFMNLFNYFSYN